MINYELNPVYSRGSNPWIQLISLVLITLGGMMLIGTGLGLIAANMMTGLGMKDLIEILRVPNNYPQYRSMVLVVQGVASFGTFIVAPFIFYVTMVNGSPKSFFNPLSQPFLTIALSLIIVFSFMIVNSLFVEWNMNVNLPDWWGFEEWAKESEEKAKVLTQYLTDFNSLSYFFLAILVVAVLPAIGEELLFRGLLQNIILKISKNGHVAIWIAAIVFGTIHLQFYGVLPRILLGALFGYLYLWTKNLWIPIIGHFLNNFFSLFALYIHQKGLMSMDPESEEAFPMAYIALFALLFIVLMYYLRNNILKVDIDEKLGDDM